MLALLVGYSTEGQTRSQNHWASFSIIQDQTDADDEESPQLPPAMERLLHLVRLLILRSSAVRQHQH